MSIFNNIAHETVVNMHKAYGIKIIKSSQGLEMDNQIIKQNPKRFNPNNKYFFHFGRRLKINISIAYHISINSF
jgi:hypothetical protein